MSVWRCCDIPVCAERNSNFKNYIKIFQYHIRNIDCGWGIHTVFLGYMRGFNWCIFCFTQTVWRAAHSEISVVGLDWLLQPFDTLSVIEVKRALKKSLDFCIAIQRPLLWRKGSRRSSFFFPCRNSQCLRKCY